MLSVKCITYEGNFPFGLGCMAPYGMSNKEVILCGTLQGIEESQQTKTAKALKILPKAAIGAFIIGGAIKQPGKFSDKVGRALLTTAEFAVLGTGLKVYDKIKDKCIEKSPSAQKLNENQPALSAILSLGGAFLAMGLALFGTKKLVHLGAKKYPKIAQNIQKEFRKAADFADKKPIAKSVEDFKNKYQNFAKKRGSIYKFAAENIFPIGLLAYIGTAIGLRRKNSEERDKMIAQNILEIGKKRDSINFMMGG